MQVSLLKKGLLLGLTFFCLQFTMQAQTVLGGWDVNPATAYGVSPYAATTTDPNVTVGGLTRGSAVTTINTGAARAWGGNGWNLTAANGITGNQFITCTIKANTGYQISLNSFNPFNYRRTSTGASNLLLQYSLDGTNYTDIGSPLALTVTNSTGGTLGPIDMSNIAALQNVSDATTITFRFVPYGATAVGGNFYIWDFINSTANDLVINGSATAVSTCTIPGEPQCVIPASVCAGNAVTIIGAGSVPTATTYTYWNAATGGSQITTGVVGNDLTTSTSLSAGTYPFYVQAEDGTCVSATRQQVNVQINNPANANVSGGGTACANQTLPNVSIALTGTAPWDFTYSDGTNSFPITGNTTNPYVIANALAGTYTITSVSGDGCAGVGSGSAVVTVNPTPTVTASALPMTICANETTAITASGADTYEWMPGSLTGSSIVSPSSTNTYTITGTDANTCTSSTVVSFSVNPLPTVTASAMPMAVCQYESSTLTASGADSYSWMPGSLTGASIVSPSSTNTYTVTGTDLNSCSASTVVSFTVNALPNINTSATATNTCLGSSVTLSATSTSLNPIFEWTKDYTTYYPITVADVPTSTAQSIYSIRVTDANSCSFYSSVFVNVNPPSGILAQASGGVSVTGFADRTQVQPANSFLHYFDAACNLISSINLNVSGATALDSTDAEVVVDGSVQTFNGQPYCRRHFYILPQTQGIAEVTLYLTQSDFDDYNANNGTWPDLPTGPTDMVGINNVRITKVEGDGLGFSPATVLTPNMVWNGNYWEAKFMVSSFSKFYFHAVNQANGPLPIVLSNFQGKQLLKMHQLTWTSGSEKNNASYNVLRSKDGVQYEKIGSVVSKAVDGNSNSELNYVFENRNPTLGHNYYKIESVDLDGKTYSFSSVVDLNQTASQSQVFVSPNPMQDYLTVDYYALQQAKVDIRLVNAFGQTIQSVQGISQYGMNNYQLPTASVSKGLYFVQVFANGKLEATSKVSK